MNEITEFKGKNFFLSNFYNTPVVFEGLLFLSSEAAFQAAKSLDPCVRKQFTILNPSESKKLGRTILLRADWEEVKDSVMETIVRDKFLRNYTIKQKLLETGEVELIEGNTWNDTYWGVCNGVGQNKLGKILMKIREECRMNLYKGVINV